MSKVLGLFVFKYAKPYIPLEIQSMIVKYLRSTQLEYLATKNPGEWCEKAKFSKEFRNSVVWKIIFDKPPIDKLYNLDIDWYKFSKYTIPVEFIEDNPDKNWDWFVLTRKIGLRFIKEHIDYNWDWRHMMHKNVSNDFIIKHKDKPWNWLDMWVYICVDEKLLSATIEKNWNWYYITKSVSIEFILAHDKNWDWELATKKVVNIKHFELDKPWDWHEIKNVTGEFVECHVDKSWNFYKLLRLEIIDYHFIDKHPEIDWYWKTLSYCKITPEFVDKYSEKNWDWEYYLSRNENISEWLVEIYIHKPWDWKELARNPAISPQFLVDYVVDFKFISNNPNLTEEFIEKYIDEDWNWGKLNVSFEFIDKYPDKSWIWKNLHNKNGLSFLRRQESKQRLLWIPAFAGMTKINNEFVIVSFFIRKKCDNLLN